SATRPAQDPACCPVRGAGRSALHFERRGGLRPLDYKAPSTELRGRLHSSPDPDRAFLPRMLDIPEPQPFQIPRAEPGPLEAEVRGFRLAQRLGSPAQTEAEVHSRSAQRR